MSPLHQARAREPQQQPEGQASTRYAVAPDHDRAGRSAQPLGVAGVRDAFNLEVRERPAVTSAKAITT
jgi:hypothetical protein